jgi:type IV pilus assembly protein PilC
MTFGYTAFDAAGRRVSGTIEAAEAAKASELLRQQGLFAAKVSASNGTPAVATGAGGRSGPKLRAGRRLRSISQFTQQVHVLVSSGTPLVQAISAVERQVTDPAWRNVITELRGRVESGTPLAVAMESAADVFDPVCRSLVAAGESSGNLGTMLERLAMLMRKQLQLRTAIIGAMVYPSLLILIGIVVLIVMIMFVLPRFAGLFQSLDSPLPPSTKLLLWLSDLLRSYWWIAMGAFLAAAISLKSWRVTPSGRRATHSLLLSLPKVGVLTRSLMSARIARLLGVLLESKIPLVEALALVRQAAVNMHYGRLLASAEDAVSRGQSISSIMAESELIVPPVQEAIRNGELSGQLGRPLVQMADFLDEENEVVVKSLMSLLEPLILIVLGLIVGVIAISMFLPLFDLVANVGGGAQ